jgi:putative phosphoserine phosphatase/1-acylglycerol-3-phosphate O-acyltransferase
MYDRWQGQREILKFMPVYLGHKINLVSDSAFRDKWLRTMAGALAGMSRQEITTMYEDVLDNYMGHLYHDDVTARLKQHTENGASVVLVSGMFIEMVEMIAERIGAAGAIGSRMAYDAEGIATGSIDGETCVGARKLDFIRRYLEVHHPETDLSACYGYADSYSDRSLLAAVGHSVATYPDEGMRDIAESNGWEIIPT